MSLGCLGGLSGARVAFGLHCKFSARGSGPRPRLRSAV